MRAWRLAESLIRNDRAQLFSRSPIEDEAADVPLKSPNWIEKSHLRSSNGATFRSPA